MTDTADYVAIRRVQDAFADIVTRGAWRELTDIFADDASITVDTRTGRSIELIGPAELAALTKKATEGLALFQFVILNSRVFLHPDGDPDRAAARMYIVEIRCDGESGDWSNSYGVYHDRFARAGDAWVFSRRTYHSLARTIPGSPVYPLPSGDLL